MPLCHQLNADLHPTIWKIQRALNTVNEHDPWDWFRENTASNQPAQGLALDYQQLREKFEAEFENGQAALWFENYIYTNWKYLQHPEDYSGEDDEHPAHEWVSWGWFKDQFKERLEKYNAAVDLLNNWQDTPTRMQDALQVISLDPKISAWLQENDPKALEQIRAAIKEGCKVLGLGEAIREVYYNKAVKSSQRR